MNLHSAIAVIQSHDIEIFFTKKEAMVLAKMLKPQVHGEVTAGLRIIEAGILDKIKGGMKKVFKKLLGAALSFIVLTPTAQGLVYEDINKLEKTMEEYAQTGELAVDVDVDIKEKRDGGMQKLEITIVDPDDPVNSKATIYFVGTANDSLNAVTLEMTDDDQHDDPWFGSYVRVWHEAFQEQIERATEGK